jgi:hypothetical protein
MNATAPWLELKADLEKETAIIFETCPDEIKRFYYGIITHSDAGKYAKDQYFGHWVHVYGEYYAYSSTTLASLIKWAGDPDFTLPQMKKLFGDLSIGALGLGYYGGQAGLGKFTQRVLDSIDKLENKQQLVELLQAFAAYVSRLYWWVHWYFPWGLGPVIAHRKAPEDIREMARLAGLAP